MEVREQLSALLDGELAEAGRAQVDAHLALCGACARQRDELLALRQSLRAWEAPRLHPFADARIEEAVLRHARGTGLRRRWRLGLRTPVLLVPVAAAVAALVLFPRHSRQRSEKVGLPAPPTTVARREDSLPPTPVPAPVARVTGRHQTMAPGRKSGDTHREAPSAPARKVEPPVPAISSGGGVELITSAVLAETTTPTPAESTGDTGDMERDLLDRVIETQ